MPRFLMDWSPGVVAPRSDAPATSVHPSGMVTKYAPLPTPHPPLHASHSLLPTAPSPPPRAPGLGSAILGAGRKRGRHRAEHQFAGVVRSVRLIGPAG